LVPELHNDADVILHLGRISFKEMIAIVPAAKSSSSSNGRGDAKGFDRWSVAARSHWR
jgi:hypothetical protein